MLVIAEVARRGSTNSASSTCVLTDHSVYCPLQDPCGSPAMKTRPRRKAATRNVRSSRREARRRHREEEGPVYTSEDREVRWLATCIVSCLLQQQSRLIDDNNRRVPRSTAWTLCWFHHTSLNASKTNVRVVHHLNRDIQHYKNVKSCESWR